MVERTHLVVVVAIVAEEVTAPMVPVVVSGLRFKVKPVLGPEEVPGRKDLVSHHS